VEARKITIPELYLFYCAITKSENPMSESTFGEYVGLETALTPEAKALLCEIFKTAKRLRMLNVESCLVQSIFHFGIMSHLILVLNVTSPQASHCQAELAEYGEAQMQGG
jgi:hypothetical protein